MDLAEKGDSLKLDITMKDVGAEGESNVDKKEDSKDDVYAMMEDMMPRPVFLWGKAVGGKLSEWHFIITKKVMVPLLCNAVAYPDYETSVSVDQWLSFVIK